MDDRPPIDDTYQKVVLPVALTKAPRQVVKALFLSANPKDTTPLQLDEEIRAIDQAIQQARYRDRFVIEQHWAVRASDLRELLLRHQPDIVHFSGHGSSSNELILLDEAGEAQLVTAVALSNLFGLLKDNIRCVVLNACFSAGQAQAIAQHIDVVIGMSQALGDEAAIKFVAAFYQAIAYGRDLQNAFQLGCAQIKLANLPDTDTPQLVALRVNPAQLVLLPSSTPAPVGRSRALRDRQALLSLVKDFWIEQVLHQTVPAQGALTLRMALQATTMQSELWEMAQQQPEAPIRLLPSDCKISQLFAEEHGSLLILGEPGSGKTTLLLELAKDRLECAEQDPGEPIPVVLNLASWAEGRLPLAEWLVEELRVKYRIPAKISQPWVEQDDLLLLLDGLDQVRPEAQSACVTAINQFCDQHKVELAVCCRTKEYETIEPRLALYSAIILQPLTSAQVEHYWVVRGLASSPLAQAIQHDPNLQQLAQTPLMLKIMSLALSDSELALQTGHPQPEEEYRWLIFNRYIEQMLQRQSGNQPYTLNQTNHWLGWLAQNMQRHGQVEFLIEQLQPIWLPLRAERYCYEAGVRLLTGFLVLLVCSIAGLLIALVKPQIASSRIMLGIGLIGIFVLFPFLVASGLIRRLNFWLTHVISVGLTIVLGVVSFYYFGSTSQVIVAAGVVMGLLLGLPASLAGAAFGGNTRIAPRDKLTWSWQRAFWGAGLGAGVGLITSVIGQSPGDGLVVGLLVSAAVLPILGLTRASEIPLTQHPNQGIKQSARNALLTSSLTLLACFCASMIWGVFYAPKVADGLAAGLLLGMPISLITGLVYGGSVTLQHFMLRLLIAWRGYLPWQCANFLEFAVDRALLHRVGGSYLFIHTLLRDHFAALLPEHPQKMDK